MSSIPQQRPTILVFDSGAGGLTVAKEILTLNPACNLVYATDHAYFPYGTKDDDALTQRIVSLVGPLVEEHAPDIVVVACNTASTLALENLRKAFSCPFVGVVPAIKPAALESKSGVIGVLATPATVKRSYTQDLIAQFAKDKEVLLIGSDLLVEYAERKLTGEALNIAQIHAELARFWQYPKALEMDTIVLACTHFPLLREEFAMWEQSKGASYQWIDSGPAIAKRVKFLLQEKGITPSKSSASHTREDMRVSFILQSNASSEHYLQYLWT